MTKTRTEHLEQELTQFQEEQEKIRALIGGIGGRKTARAEKLANVAFTGAVILLFTCDLLRHWAHVPIPIAPMFSLELGVLLVSLKIIWMIRNQTRVEHFQFWILNSIEFRVDQISNRLRNIEKQARDRQNDDINA